MKENIENTFEKYIPEEDYSIVEYTISSSVDENGNVSIKNSEVIGKGFDVHTQSEYYDEVQSALSELRDEYDYVEDTVIDYTDLSEEELYSYESKDDPELKVVRIAKRSVVET